MVIESSLEIASNVQGDEATAGLEKPALKARTELKAAMRARADLKDDQIVAAGGKRAAQNKVRRELRLGGRKIAAFLATERLAGEKHAVFVRLFARKTPATYLPADPDDRVKALADFEKEVAKAATPAEVKKLAAPVLKAIVRERAALEVFASASEALRAALAREEEKKLKVVAAIRALTAAVQGKFADDPARAREALGWGEPARRKATKTAEAAKTGKAPAPAKADESDAG